MPFSTFFPDAQPQNNPEYARLLLYLLVFLTLKMKNVHYSCSTPPDRVPLVFKLLFLERIKFWRPSFLQNCANRRFRKVMIKTSFQLFLLRKTVQKLAWKSLLSKKLLTCSSGEPISSPRGGGGVFLKRLWAFSEIPRNFRFTKHGPFSYRLFTKITEKSIKIHIKEKHFSTSKLL